MLPIIDFSIAPYSTLNFDYKFEYHKDIQSSLEIIYS